MIPRNIPLVLVLVTTVSSKRRSALVGVSFLWTVNLSCDGVAVVVWWRQWFPPSSGEVATELILIAYGIDSPWQGHVGSLH